MSAVELLKSDVKLNVIGGRHTGAVHDGLGEALVVGSSLDADLVLTDPGVCPRHLRACRGRQGVELEAIDGSAVVNGQSLQPGQKARAKLPITVVIGAAKIELVWSKSWHSQFGLLPLVGASALLVLIWLLGLSLGTSGPGGGAKIRLAAGASLSRSNVSPRAPSATGDIAVQSEDANAAASALDSYLNSQNLAGINVKAGAGRVTAAGSISPEQAGEWRSAQMWFDEHFGPKIMLESGVTASIPKAIKAPITIQSAWLGGTPYIIDGDGNKYFEGAMLKDGWALEKIEDGKVRVVKNKLPLIVRY